MLPPARRPGSRSRAGIVAAGRVVPAGVPDPELVGRPSAARSPRSTRLRSCRAEACTKSGRGRRAVASGGPVYVASGVLAQAAQGRRAEGARQAARAQAGRPSRRGDREAHAEAGALRGGAREGEAGRSRSRETSQRCWRRCSVPRARRGAPSDDRRDRRGADAVDRDSAGVPGAGRLASDDLPSPPAAAATGGPAAADARAGR